MSDYICKDCGADKTGRRGNLALALVWLVGALVADALGLGKIGVLFLFFLLVTIVASIFTGKQFCKTCKSKNVIPKTSPEGALLVAKYQTKP